ncbi:MAG: lactonase, partial [Proteobacteria bacterium]|nr:lactonase [Pseudomonadota bacterium]
MKTPVGFLTAVAAVTLAAASASAHNVPPSSHAVFVMTNDATSNEIVAYPRTSDGTLLRPPRYRTAGRGSGGKVDPLTSQGSLTLSRDGSLLFAVNAGSGTLSVFRVRGAELERLDVAPTQGSEANAVAQCGSTVYVLNAAGSSSVVGFRGRGGK